MHCEFTSLAFVAGRLIPLDKCPGVTLIGVGELSRKTIARAILDIVRTDATTATGCLLEWMVDSCCEGLLG